MVIRLTTLIMLAVVLVTPTAVRAQGGGDDLKALRREIESLKGSIGAVQRDLQEIKTLLQGARQAAGPPPPGAPESLELSVANSYVKGGAGARIVLVEFSDFQCPYCARHALQTLPQIQKEYVDTGKILYVMRNLPLESIHPDAFRAAVAAECAGDQGKYWQMHEKLFVNQQALSAASITRYAQESGVEAATFKRCVETDAHSGKIRQDLSDAQAAGVTGTPTFFLGVTDGGGKVKVQRRIQGAQPFPVFKTAIDGLLAEGAKK